jgi:hypothetical protein
MDCFLSAVHFLGWNLSLRWKPIQRGQITLGTPQRGLNCERKLRA